MSAFPLGFQSSLKSKVHVVFVPFVSFTQRLQQRETQSNVSDIFTSTIHALLTLHTAESSAVLELDFQLHKLVSHRDYSKGKLKVMSVIFSLPPYTPCSRCILLRVLRCWS